MAKYKPGQFAKVKNAKGLYRVVLEQNPYKGCRECAFSEFDCNKHFDCSQIPFNACLKRIK